MEINIDGKTEWMGLDMVQIGETSYHFNTAGNNSKKKGEGGAMMNILAYKLCTACKKGDYRHVLSIVSSLDLHSVNVKDHDQRTPLVRLSLSLFLPCYKSYIVCDSILLVMGIILIFVNCC